MRASISSTWIALRRRSASQTGIQAAHGSANWPQSMHWPARSINSGCNCCDSGLAHQPQRSGQPFRKTFVRTPGPSCMDMRCTLKTTPRVCSNSWRSIGAIAPSGDTIAALRLCAIQLPCVLASLREADRQAHVSPNSVRRMISSCNSRSSSMK
jgi:hypothetical protein